MINKEEFKKVVEESKTIREVLKKINLSDTSSAYKFFRKKIKEWDISTNHFLSKKELIQRTFLNGKIVAKKDDEIFCENSKVTRVTLKRRILKEKIKEYVCEMCENKGEWMNKKISLIIDHINGINNDNRIINLRFLCPNCAATLETHCVGYKGLIKKEKIKKERKYFERPNQRKVKNRPSKDELKEMIESTSFVAVAKKYEVSDMAVRKWAKYYKII